jgi:hypothetical protein
MLWNLILRDAEDVDGGAVETPEEISTPGVESESEGKPAAAGDDEPGEAPVPPTRFKEIYRKMKENEERALKAEERAERYQAEQDRILDEMQRKRNRPDREQPEPRREPQKPEAPQGSFFDSLPADLKAIAGEDRDAIAWTNYIGKIIQHSLGPFQQKIEGFDQQYGSKFQEMQHQSEVQQLRSVIEKVALPILDSAGFKGHPLEDRLRSLALQSLKVSLDEGFHQLPRSLQLRHIERTLTREVQSLSEGLGLHLNPAVKKDKAAEAARKSPATASARPGSVPERDDLINQLRDRKKSGRAVMSELIDRD